MTPKEAGKVLAIAAAFDNRKPTAESAVLWANALRDIPFKDASEAVAAHYAESTDWVMPAHIRRRVALLRAARLALVTEPALPPDMAPAAYRDALRAWRRQVADGGDPELALASVYRRELTGGAS